MAVKAKPRKATPAESRRATEDRIKQILTSSTRVIVQDDIAEGSRATIKRPRVADPLDRLELVSDKEIDRTLRHAAVVFRQAYEHLQSGRSLGPMPWAKDRVDETATAGDRAAVIATSAATWYRRGVQAMGLAASEGVVRWVVIRGLPLCAYDAFRGWRKGRGKAELVGALQRLSDAYFPPVRGVATQDLTSGVDITHDSP